MSPDVSCPNILNITPPTLTCGWPNWALEQYRMSRYESRWQWQWRAFSPYSHVPCRLLSMTTHSDEVGWILFVENTCEVLQFFARGKSQRKMSFTRSSCWCEWSIFSIGLRIPKRCLSTVCVHRPRSLKSPPNFSPAVALIHFRIALQVWYIYTLLTEHGFALRTGICTWIWGECIGPGLCLQLIDPSQSCTVGGCLLWNPAPSGKWVVRTESNTFLWSLPKPPPSIRMESPGDKH